MANFIIRLFQRNKLKKIISPNKGKYVPLPEAKKVGYIFSKEEAGISDAITILESRCKKLGISCQGLEIIKEELNWISVPVSPKVEEFLTGDYDIVFDMGTTPSFANEYILKRCKSGTIVGFCPQRAGSYDMHFSKGEGIKDYIEQSLHYLTIIKTK